MVYAEKQLKSAFIFGTFFSVVPIATVSIFEYIFFKIIYPNAIDINFTPPSLSYVQTEGYLTPALCIAIYILTSLFAACFKEMFFRGFLLHKLEKLTTLKVANIFQALLYMTFVIPKLIRNFAMNYYSEDIVKLAAFVVIFYLVHEFITGLKWGMLAKVSGAVYISIIDNFLYVFLANSLHIVDQSTKWLFMIHMLATQLISLALVVIYCKKASSAKSVEEKTSEKKSTVAAKEKTKNPAPIETHEEKEVINIEDFNDKAEISPSQFKEIIKENTVQSALPHNGELSEEEIDSYLKDFGKPKGQYNPPKTSKPDMAKETVESFDVDDFLKGFSNS